MLKNKKILVTGGSGFIGTNLIIHLAKKGAKVTNVGMGKPLVKIESVVNIEEDLTKSDFWFVEQGFDYVIHLAALSNLRMCENSKDAFEINVLMTEKFFNKLNEPKVKNNLKKVVFMSTVLVYSKHNKLPINEQGKLDIEKNVYAKTKGIDEQICEKYRKKGLPIITFRLSNIYGPYQAWQGDANLVPHLIRSALLGKKMEAKNGSTIRDWIYVEDAAKAIAKSLESSFTGTMNLGTGAGKSVGDVAKVIGKLTDSKFTDLNEKIEKLDIVCDISLAKKTLNWKPETNFDEGVKKTLKYYKKTLGK